MVEPHSSKACNRFSGRKGMRRFGIVWITLLIAMSAFAEVEVWYIRHAEAGHNVAGRYKAMGVPTNEWPSWVGHARVFSPEGQLQVEALAANLPPKGTFDLIAVSPLWRTRNTIIPYLRRTGQQGEIWPELAETKNFGHSTDDPEAPVRLEFLEGSSDLVVEEDEAGYFLLREDSFGRRMYDAWPATYAEARYMAERVVSMLEERFANTDAKVLLVGHGNANLTLLRLLTGDPDFHGAHLGNTHGWLVRGTLPGTFRVEQYNELPPFSR